MLRSESFFGSQLLSFPLQGRLAWGGGGQVRLELQDGWLGHTRAPAPHCRGSFTTTSGHLVIGRATLCPLPSHTCSSPPLC